MHPMRMARRAGAVMAWALLPALTAAVMTAGCARESSSGPVPAEGEAPEAAAGGSFSLRLTGRDYRWHARYPGPDGLLDTPDDILSDRGLHLPAASEITIDLRSEDWTYLFYVPDLGIMETAIREMPFQLRFSTDVAGTFRIRGGQMCGLLHPDLLGELVVHSPQEFRQWQSAAGVKDSGPVP